MAKVTGIGGVFFKATDVAATQAWYRDHLGVDMGDFGGVFRYADAGNEAFSIFSAFKAETTYLDPSPHGIMINLRVDDLDGLQTHLEAHGVPVERKDEDYGKFAWVIDPNGIKIELWEQIGPAPPA